jgi:PAS domain S-box-containing protein
MGTKLKILMIEDIESDAALNIRALETAGYEVAAEIVTTAAEMRTALDKSSFDLLLSDHNLPQFDSPAALAVFQERHLDIPFIIVSGAIGEETAVGLMKAGAQDYVMKSNLARLAPAVERELKDAEARRHRKESEEKLRTSEERFRQVADIAGELIWEIDENMQYIYVNRITESVTGYAAEELVGKKSIFDFFPAEARQVYQCHLLESFKNRQTFRSFTSPRVRKDGRMIILETSATPRMGTNGNFLGYRGTDTDVTRRKQMEAKIGDLYIKEKQQRQKLQEEAETRNFFINVLAHELRNPLTAVMVSSEMLQESPDLREELRIRLASNIYESAKLLTRRLDELLDLARYSRGTIELKKDNVDAPQFLKQVIQRFIPTLEKRSQRLNIEISQELGNIIIDTSRIEQVIINLLSNASKYSPENCEITLKAGLEDHQLRLEVVDQGSGIPLEDQRNLFQPYYRASKTQGVPGTGLGLAISNKIIEAHGGKIQVNSQPGEGSKFSVLIPAG